MATKRLTARFVETATTDIDREDIRDAATRGLQLRVSRHGAKSWALRYRRKSDRKLRRLTLGAFPAVSLEEARQQCRDHLAAIGRGADPAGEAKDRRAAETFAEVAREWTDRHARQNKAFRTLRNDGYMLERHILPEIGAMKAAEVTKRDIIRMLDRVAQKPDARGGVGRDPRKLTHQPNRVFQLVRAIFRWAVGRDMLKADPTWGLSAPIKKEKPRERDLSPEEIRRLWEVLDKAPVAPRTTRGLRRGQAALGEGDLPFTRSIAIALRLALATGQRIGEVTSVAIADLDLNDVAPMWSVPADRTKNGQGNRVPLSPLAVRLIAEARALGAGSAWLFPSPSGDGPIDPHAPTKAVLRGRKAIGLGDFRVHDLRRTAATRMAEMGIAPHTISLVLNHVSARRGTITSKVYVQYSYDREKREALNAWGARLERIIEAAEGGNVVPLMAGATTDRG